MSTNTTVLMIVFAFALIPLVLAEIARNKSVPSIEDFFLQNRKMPTIMVFFTVYATWMSAYAFLGAGGYFYEKGPIYMTAIGWDILFGLLFFVVGKRLWFYGKENGYITPMDFFNDIYRSGALNLLVTVVTVIFTLFYLQIQLIGGAYLIEIATDGLFSWRVSGLVFYLIMIIYLWAGGLRAVAYADVFYSILMVGGILFSGGFLMWKAGGAESMFQHIIALNEKNVALPGPDGDAGALLWLSMFLIVPIGAMMGPQMWIRCYAAEGKKTFNILPFLICIASVQCLGTMLAGSAGIVLNDSIEKADNVIPILILEYGTPLMCGLIFCGIAAAVLSTANSQIHALSAIYTIDIHKKYINPNISEKKLVNIGKWAVVFASALAYTRILSDPKMIMDTGAFAFGGTAQLFVPLAGALFWKSANARAASVGILVGCTILIVGSALIGVNANYCAVIALFCNAAVFALGSLLLPGDFNTRERIVLYRTNYQKKE